MPKGLIYDGSDLKVTGASTSPLQWVSYPNDGTQNVQVEWAFGDVDNSLSKDITISFNLIVANVEGNYEGVALGAVQARATWKDLLGITYSNTDRSDLIRVIEPDLDVKLFASSKIAEPGTEVVHTISIYHSADSSSDALDADVQVSVPKGLTYSPGSMQIVSGPSGIEDESNLRSLSWHFDRIDTSWGSTHQVQLRYKATIDENVRSGSQLTSLANLGWYSTSRDNPGKRTYSKSAECSISIISKPPDLRISLAGSPDPVSPGGYLNYTMSYLNRGGYAFNAVVEANYDKNISFISATLAPDADTNNRWTLGDLGKNKSGLIKINTTVKADALDGSTLSSSAAISSDDGLPANATATTTVSSKPPILSIEKFASAPIITPWNHLNYTINYYNKGASNASNVTVTDIIDKNLNFIDSTPKPSKNWTEVDGKHLWWSAVDLNTKNFTHGSKGIIELKVTLPSGPTSLDLDSVYNFYRIDSNEIKGSFNSLETFVVHSLWVKKKAEKQVYSDGDIVNYTIFYGSEHDVRGNAYNAAITDVLPDDMEYLGADPSPTNVNGNILLWNIGTIRDGDSRTIYLYAEIKENISQITFDCSGSVHGQGFVNVHQKLDTAQKPDHLTNCVNITGYYYNLTNPNQWDAETKSSSATIQLAEGLGTEASITGHGSGAYRRDEKMQMIAKNKSIQIGNSLSERYNPSSFSLPQGRSISYNSKWSEAQNANNRITGAILSERYMYASLLDRNSSLDLDKNGSTLVSDTSFEGAAHIDLLKKAGGGETSRPKDAPTYESHGDYLGSFRVYTKFDEYGKNAVLESSASGIGSVAAESRIGKSQQSYESGTGAYQIEDSLETQTNYMAKDINVTYAPVKYAYVPDVNVTLSKRWSEGMWSKSGSLAAKGSNSSYSASLISEEISHADYLNMSTAAKGLSEMDTEANFSGIAQFNVIKISGSNRSKDEVALYDEYIGKYRISRKTVIGGVVQFDEPHLDISKTGNMDPAGGTNVHYIITVTNNGNRALGPVYVWDYFPPGTAYVYSSLRPSQLTPNSAQWTLTSLGTGVSSKIELRLNMTHDMDNLVNRVQAKGGYDNQWIGAENSSAIELNWLSCCPPQILARETGYVDAKGPMLVHYNITLKNREGYTMVASITDTLPEGMEFVNSTLTPADNLSDQVTWNIIDIKPGEVRTIEYLARALHSGIFENQAHVETHSFDGTDFASADVSCQEEIKGDHPTISSSWQPPGFFGLNSILQDSGDEWLPCYNCTGAEEEEISPSQASCPCISTSGSDEGYDIP